MAKTKGPGGGVRSETGAGAPAVTVYAWQRSAGGSLPLSLIQLDPRTGRTHQLRVQSSAHGHPILGDRTGAQDLLMPITKLGTSSSLCSGRINIGIDLYFASQLISCSRQSVGVQDFRFRVSRRYFDPACISWWHNRYRLFLLSPGSHPGFLLLRPDQPNQGQLGLRHRLLSQGRCTSGKPWQGSRAPQQLQAGRTVDVFAAATAPCIWHRDFPGWIAS
jgi:hypothetical protein